MEQGANEHFAFTGFLNSGQHADDGSYAVAHSARDRARQFGSGQRTYSRQEIQKFYDRRRQGLYDDAQWARLEAEIIAAGREGRITGGLDINGR
jgi:hypothetical protein